MDKIIISSGLSFIITFFAIPIIIQIAKEKKLFDEPNQRKIHKIVIPTLGGLGIYAGFVIAMLIFVPFYTSSCFQYYVASSLVIFFLGLKDDILVLSPTKKFLGQLIAAWILFKFAGVQLNNMHGLFGIYQIPNGAATVLSLFTIVVITNSFNLIDGVDGLAGSLGILTTTLFGIYFFAIGETAHAVMAFILTGSLISFLIYNFPPAKIFMGDTGSLLVGLMNAILVIKFINIADTPGISYPIPSTPAIGFAILLVPLFDTLRVFSIRIFSRRSPFSPDRNHIHHLLLDLGFSHKQTTFICLTAAIFFISLGFILRELGSTVLISILFLLPLCITVLLYQYKNRRKKSNVVFSEKELVTSNKIFTLAHEPVDVD
jgi:UDP-N-acetylmuramyl pentapeptide phosphotransferase/UDP-N-acetylglucosamine-1-phosphate transferase